MRNGQNTQRSLPVAHVLFVILTTMFMLALSILLVIVFFYFLWKSARRNVEGDHEDDQGDEVEFGGGNSDLSDLVSEL